MRLLFFLLLFYGHPVHSEREPECFFPESELRPFFYEITSSVPSGSVIADSLVDPPEAQMILASIRSSELPQVNFTEKFTLIKEETGRFRLVSNSPLSLPSYPSPVSETLLYATVLCNNRPYPLMTIRITAANSVAPAFVGEPYRILLDEKFDVGSEADTPISVVDWDPSAYHSVNLQLENNTSFELIKKEGVLPSGVEDASSWKKEQLPPRFSIRQITPATFPVVLKLIATDNGNPPHSTISSIRLEKRTQRQATFAKCKVSASIPENSPAGTHVLRLPLENYGREISLRLVDPDGSFVLERDELLVADKKLIDRELFSTLEVIVEIENSDKSVACPRLRIRVDLEDENDNRPVFERESYWFHLSEEVAPGQEFAVLKARDVDDGENGRVTYSLLNDSVPFRIYPRGRDTVLATTHEIGGQEKYTLVVEASDHGTPARATKATVDVFVMKPTVNKTNNKQRKENKEKTKVVDVSQEEKEEEKEQERQEETVDEPSSVRTAVSRTTPVLHGSVQAVAPTRKEEGWEETIVDLPLPRKESKAAPVLRGSVQTVTDPKKEEEREEAVDEPHIPRKQSKTAPVLRGVVQAVAQPKQDLRGLPPLVPEITRSPLRTTSTTTAQTTVNNSIDEPSDGIPTQTEDYGDSNEIAAPFGFTADHYYYEVFGVPNEDDVFGRVVAEPNPQMYGLERKVAGLFKIDADIGELAVGKKLYDNESGNISFTVSATDGVSTAKAVVTVLFEPDKQSTESVPHFDQTRYKFRVEEGVPPEVIGIVRAFHISASSRSSSASLKYSLDGPPGLPFSVDPLSGEVVNESPLDREKNAFFNFTVRACLSEPSEVCGSAGVDVLVGDVNDHVPRFASSLLHVTLPSDVPVGTEVARVRATDEDLGDNAAISYQIVPSSDIFAVDANTGRIVTISSLSESRYTLLIQATDHGQTPRSDATEVRIRVLGTNPSAPAFDQQHYEVVITPPTPAGAVVAQVKATDPDPGPEGHVMYRFAETDDPKEKETQSRFEINSKTGVVSSVKILRAGEGPFDLLVEAFDGSNTFSRKTSALLHVEMGAESTLRFLPLPVTLYISTEKAVGSVILRASASTTSSSPVHFRVLEENTPFAMDGDLLRVVSHLFPGRSQLTIRAETESLFADHRLTVVAMDDSDKYPIFPQLTYDVDVAQDSTFPTVVARFTARVRNGSVSYELHPEAPPGLSLDENTGDLTVETSDFNQGLDTAFVVVRGRNTLFPSFYSDVGVALNRIDRRPKLRFGQIVYRLEVAENTPVGSIVSHPLDIFPRNLPIRFHLEPSDSPFAIHENGTVFVRKDIDVEKLRTTTMQLTVVAEARNGETTSSKIQVELIDENEFSPEIMEPLVKGHVSEDAPPGTPVANIEATDGDFTEGSHLLYRIVGGTGKDLVFIQEDGTLILGEKPLDHEEMASFDVQVEVYDRNGNKASATAVISVDDVNDNGPSVDGPLVWNVVENDPDAQFEFRAKDGDSGHNGRISYRIVQGNALGHFRVNDENGKGVLRLASPLDYEEQRTFHLSIEAKDGGQPPRSAIFAVEVVVENENDNRPSFKPRPGQQRISADIPIGYPAITLIAEDPDGDRLRFSLSGDDCSALSVDPLGVVSWSVPASKRPIGLLNCTATVSDGINTASTRLLLDVFSAQQPTTTSPNRAPVFSQPEYSFIADGPVNSRIGQVMATDPDGDQVLFVIKPAQYRNLFDVDENGYISLKVPLSDLSQSQYSFLVSAEDWGPPIMSTVINVHVTLPTKISTSIDSNETPDVPVFETTDRPTTEYTEPVTTRFRPTEAPTRTTSKTTTERPKDIPLKENEQLAPSPDVKPIIKFLRPVYTYSIRGDSPAGTYLGQISLTYNKGVHLEVIGDGQLIIDEAGRLRTNKALTSERINQTMIAIKDGVRIAEAPVVVHVIGVPTTTTTTPSTTSTTTTTTTTTTSSTTTTTTRSPPLPSSSTPSTTPPPPPPTSTSEPDLSSEEILVTMTPETSDSSRIPLRFSFERPMYFAFVPEGKYSSGMKVAVKPEPFATNVDGPVQFALRNTSGPLPFYLTNEGELICFDMDREQRSSYLAEVVATHGEEEAFATLNVTVLDVNDNYPVFTKPVDVIGLASDALVGSTVRSFAATDADAGTSGAILYEISGEASPYFSIDPTYGVLTVSSPLMAAPRIMSLTVTASDQGRPAMRTRQVVVIKVFDAHSPAPLLPKDTDTLIVPEDAAPGYVIRTLLAGPSVAGPSTLEPVEYGLVDDYYELFKIDEEGHLILGRKPYPLEAGRLHQLNVTAKNSLGTDSVLVNVLLESSEVPTSEAVIPTGCAFEKQIYQVEIKEKQPAGIRVVNLHVTCPSPKFSFEQESEDFAIDENGQLFTKVSLDREKKSLHIIYINVVPKRTERADPLIESAKQKLRSNQAAVFVKVLDENDNAPVFQHTTDGKIIAHVDWQARANAPVLRLQARDFDEKPHLIYSISGAASEFFEVDAVSGVVSLKKQLTDTSEDTFEFIAEVTDGTHSVKVPVTVYKLSPETNIVRLTSEMPASQLKEFLVEHTLSEVTDSDVRVMAKGSVEGNRSLIDIYAVDRDSHRPLPKEKLVELLSAFKTTLQSSPIKISAVSVAPSSPTTLSGVDILILLLVLALVALVLFLCCFFAAYCRRRRYAAASSDREYMFSTGGGPRPYDVEAITRQTAQTVLAQQPLPSPLTTHRDSAISPAFADRGDTTRAFSNSVRERPSLLQTALSRQRVQPGSGSLSATVDVVEK